jgi:RNA recognition motif-containing protein
MLVETLPDGRPRGFAHVSFENVKNAVAAVLSATEEPIHIGGRDLVVNFAKPKVNARANKEPNEKLYFSGCAQGEAALRELMKDVEDDIVSIHFRA